MITYDAASKEIRLTKKQYSFADIHAAIDNEAVVSRLGDSYTINANLRVIERAALVDKKVSVTITGTHFQIHDGCYFQLGSLKNGVASEGGFISMPNAALAYGFGEDTLLNDATQSGNLYLYNSVLKIPCFWGFFAGAEQKVEIVDCLVRGFGRVEGTESVLRNVTFETADKRYGVLSPKGTLKEYSEINVRHSDGAAMYFNPELADNFTVKGGSFDNYKQLVYCEPLTHGYKRIRFLDSDIKGNRLIRFGSNTGFEEAYTFEPTLMTAQEDALSNIFVQVKNAQDEIVFTGLTDAYGCFCTELTVYSQKQGEPAVNHNPFTLDFIFNEETITTQLTVEAALKAPLVMLERTVVVVEEVEVPSEGSDGSGRGTSEPSADAVDAVYVCSPSHALNTVQKDRLVGWMGELYAECDVYTDIAKSAYSRCYSYEALMLNVISGQIKTLYVWEWEVLGTHRMMLAKQMLEMSGVEVIIVKERI